MIFRVLPWLMVLALGACDGGKSILEAGPRYPDREGVVEDVTFERLILDGGRSFSISPAVESFTTRSHDVTALLSWKSKYVHVGLTDENQVIWIAGIGVVAGDPPLVRYAGVFVEVKDGRAIFADGTVLRMGGGVAIPNPGEVLVTIDPRRRIVTQIEAGVS